MRRTALVLVSLALVCWTVSAISAQTEKPWFDNANCSFCQFLTKDPKLMENMTWEHHDISNGLLVVTTVKPEFKKSYLEAMGGMEKLSQEMMAGKQDVKLCGHCEYYGKLMMSGAKFEHIAAKAGDIVLITSDNPDVLKMIREYGQRTRDEMAKLEKKS